nr:coat protein [Sclerotinia sclerotiorum alphapartitivirus 1]
MSSNATAALEQAKALLRSKGLEDEFLKSAGLDSLDELSPKNFADLSTDTPKPKVSATPVPSAAPVPAPDMKKSQADSSAPAKPATPVSSDMLEPFLGTKILYASRKKLSYYWPSALMMFHITHLLNALLVDNFYFKRYCPDYHPYVLRLYFGILFIIQALRAGHDAKVLDPEQHEFLTQFLANYPPESLPIPGPLLALFKTICTSQPEILAYGKVYPHLPAQPGPATRDGFAAQEDWIMIIPQIPAILACLEDLNSKINTTTPVYPKKGKHEPVGSTAVTFGHHAFPAQATRSAYEKWFLACSGLEYPCEADAKLNEAFAERYDNFDFPTTAATDDTTSYYGFTSMNRSMSWFCNVRDVAAAAALYSEGSGTLADCSPSGIVANQFQVVYSNPATVPPAPTKTFDPASRFPLAFRLTTTARSPPALAEALASMAQTHVRFPRNHGYAPNIGSDAHQRKGSFWDVRPIEKSSEDEESFNALPGIVKRMVKSRV